MHRRGQRGMNTGRSHGGKQQQCGSRGNSSGERISNDIQTVWGTTEGAMPKRGGSRGRSMGRAKSQPKSQSGGASSRRGRRVPSSGKGKEGVSSCDFERRVLTGQDPFAVKQAALKAEMEKEGYDKFFKRLQESEVYEVRRDGIPSFPRTYREVIQLVREPTQSDYDDMGEAIRNGTFLNIESNRGGKK